MVRLVTGAQPDLAEAELCLRVQGVQGLEVRGPGPGARPDAIAVALVVRQADGLGHVEVDPGDRRLGQMP
jgi:hypothetical protein